MPTVAERTQLPAFFDRYQPVIDRALRAQLGGCTSELRNTHRYHMGWTDKNGANLVATEGKRLRPTMVLLGARAVDGEIQRALPVATALEYVHNFSLIHDDIEDRDRFRHHRPTIWVVWGDPTAIVSGNSMLKVADRCAKGLLDAGVSLDMSTAAQRLITEAYMRMIEGQYMDISFEARSDVSIEEYLAMIERKTGALIETSLYVGALVAGNSDTGCLVTEGLRKAGYQFGRLFQIRDDILGVWGSDETGKPVHGDIYNKKKSLPAVHAIDASGGVTSERIRSIYQKTELDGKDVEDVLQIMEDQGTYQFCEAMLTEHWSATAEILDALDLNADVRDDFIELGEFLVERSS